MSSRSIAFGCLLGVVGSAVLRPAPAHGGDPDFGARLTRVEELSTALQTAVDAVKESLARNTSDAENLRLRMNTVEGYLQTLQGAFAALAPGGAAPTANAASAVVPDGRVDVLEFLREGRNESVRMRVVSGRIANLPARSRLELAVSITDSDGLVRKTFESTSEVVESGEVVWLETRVSLSTDGDQDKWFRELVGRDGKPDRVRVRNLVVKFQVLSVLPPPK